MKTKILAGILSLALGFCAVSCDDDDDYSPAKGTLVQSVATGSSDVTATTATLNGTVNGLQNQSSTAYTVGFYYGSSENELTSNVVGSLDGTKMSATLTGLENNTTLFYQAYVTLQKTVTYKGEVKSLVTTNAKVSTSDASAVGINVATVGGVATDAPSDAVCGVAFAASSDVETVRAGLKVAAEGDGTFSLTQKGILPAATYYYAAYVDLGSGVIYGDVKEFTTSEFAMDADRDFVDLGLSTKWCKFNIGATSASELGGLFAFGDTTGVCSSTSLSDYSPAADIYKTRSDIAFRSLAKATIPTADEFEELFEKCDAEWTEEDGVAGYKFTGPNGNSIFLPAAGSRTGSTISEQGERGLYLTGSVNSTATDFAISYGFSNGQNDKTTTPRYQALSVRPVSVAKNIPLDKSLLYKKWFIDLDADAESYVFDGPLSYYGTGDSWATVTNNEKTYLEPIDSWNWTPKYSDNTWLGDAADYGYMQLNENGTVNIHRRVVTKDADDKDVVSYVDEDGTYEIDEVAKTITLSVDILGFGNFNNLTLDAKTSLKILSLTDESAQIAILRDPVLANDGACLLSYNYINEETYKAHQKIKANVIAVGADWSGTWGTTIESFSPDELLASGSISQTATYTGAMTGAKVFLVDFVKLAEKFPNSFVRIDGIKVDGQDLKYDASKFCYGNIEGQGTYRVEFFNQYGETCKDSPLSKADGKLDDDLSVNIAEKLEISYTVFADANVARTYDVNLVTINKSWGGTWGYNDGQTIEVGYDADTHKYTFAPKTVSFSYADNTFAEGSIMTFLEVADLYGYFPGTHATLDAIKLDGVDVERDFSKVIDANENPKYRLELWNCYGATKNNGCAFGDPDGDAMPGLAFNEKIELTVTFHGIFPAVSFE
ncbi:MAG: hypothetical protein ACI35Q_01365 [Marinilabiliaceae bacterium]